MLVPLRFRYEFCVLHISLIKQFLHTPDLLAFRETILYLTYRV